MTVSSTVEICLPLPSSLPRDALELHPLELAVLDDEPGGDVVDQDVDLLLLGVLQLPGRGLEVGAGAAGHHLDVLAAEAPRRAAAVHRGVADADDQHALADRADVLEGDALQPVDADVDPLGRFLAARAARDPCRAARPSRRTRRRSLRRAAPSGSAPACRSGLDAHVDDHRDLVVEHRGRQAEAGDVRPHEAARPAVLLEDRRPRSRAAPDRWPPSARPGRRRCRRPACRSSSPAALGSRSLTSPLRSAATRLMRQIATGFSSTRPRRQAGSHGRSQVRPRIPGNTLDSRFSMYASSYRPWATRRMYSGTLVWAGHAHWQSTTLWK